MFGAFIGQIFWNLEIINQEYYTAGDGHCFQRKQIWKTCKVHVFIENTQKTCDLFPRQTNIKHIIILLSVCIQKRKPVSFIVFQGDKEKTYPHQALGEDMFLISLP